MRYDTKPFPGRLASGGLITNYHCPSACRHCLYACSPQRSREYISEERAGRLGELARGGGVRSLHIGGGEPLLQPQRLFAAVRALRRAGFGIDYVETNSSWYRSHGEAVELLTELRNAGTGTLLVSISPFHNETVPLAKIRGVLKACREAGVGAFPWVDGFLPDLAAFAEERPHRIEEYEERFGEGYLRELPRRYWISMRGRALATYRPFMRAVPLRALLSGSGACASLRDTSHFHLDLYGNYIPGLCSGLSLPAEELGNAVDSERYPFLARLLAGGPRALLRLAQREYGFSPAEHYVSLCELCQEIRRYLVLEAGVSSPDLSPTEFYRELEG
jgi:hypothetical protein